MFLVIAVVVLAADIRGGASVADNNEEMELGCRLSPESDDLESGDDEQSNAAGVLGAVENFSDIGMDVILGCKSISVTTTDGFASDFSSSVCCCNSLVNDDRI